MLLRACSILLVLSVLAPAALSARPKSPYKPYQDIFKITKHVDGSPLLADGRVEFYLFPGAERVRTPDRSYSCGALVTNIAVQFIAAALRSLPRLNR